MAAHLGDKPAARFENPESLAQYLVLVRGQIDDTVRDDHVYGAVRKRDILDVALQKAHVLGVGSLRAVG